MQLGTKPSTISEAKKGLSSPLKGCFSDVTLAFHSALKLEKKCNFKSAKKALFAFSKMAKIQFLHQKKV